MSNFGWLLTKKNIGISKFNIDGRGGYNALTEQFLFSNKFYLDLRYFKL